MSIITQKIELIGSKARAEVKALFDSGASFSCIPPDLAEKLGEATPLAIPIELEMAEQGKALQVNKVLYLQFKINGNQLSDEFMIVPGLSEEAIIGAKTLQAWRIKLDFEHDAVSIDPEVTKLRL